MSEDGLGYKNREPTIPDSCLLTEMKSKYSGDGHTSDVGSMGHSFQCFGAPLFRIQTSMRRHNYGKQVEKPDLVLSLNSICLKTWQIEGKRRIELYFTCLRTFQNTTQCGSMRVFVSLLYYSVVTET